MSEWQEIMKDITASWDEIDEVMEDIRALGNDDLLLVLPSIKQRLDNVLEILGKYVDDKVIQGCECCGFCNICPEKIRAECPFYNSEDYVVI